MATGIMEGLKVDNFLALAEGTCNGFHLCFVEGSTQQGYSALSELHAALIILLVVSSQGKKEPKP